ncbi:MAG: hypothetical protein ACRCW7_11120 [Cetobacterium sp.]
MSVSTIGGVITFVLDANGVIKIDRIFDNTGKNVQHTGIAPSFYGNISSLVN